MNGSLQSQVALEFALNQKGEQTILTKRKTGGLCHLSKPYWDGKVLSLQLVNPTAGLFSGDRLELITTIKAGAQVALTSPSATRFHTMPNGRAEVIQSFTLGENSWLDFWPEIIIPQRNSDTIQITRLQLAKTARMVFLDTLAPGRVAHGENLAFRRLETIFEVYQDDQLHAKERNLLEPAKQIWPLEVPNWKCCYYGAIWIAGPPLAELGLFESEFCAASQLSESLAVIRMLAPSSLELKKLTQTLRTQLKNQIPQLETDFRKL